MDKKDIEEKWIKAGKPCRYQYGFTFKGAGSEPITKEKALKLLPKYSFGMGFYELRFSKIDNEDTLIFNEYSENDLL